MSLRVRATHLRAELETDKVSYVVVDHFALLNGCPVPDTHTESSNTLHTLTKMART